MKSYSRSLKPSVRNVLEISFRKVNFEKTSQLLLSHFHILSLQKKIDT